MYQTTHKLLLSPSSQKPPLFFFFVAQSLLLFPLLTLFSCSLIRCKLIAPHMGEGTRLVSILIMVCGLAAGNTLPICSWRICQMIGVYTPHPLRSVCHNATSYISITHRIPRQTSPKTHINACVWALIKTATYDMLDSTDCIFGVLTETTGFIQFLFFNFYIIAYPPPFPNSLPLPSAPPPAFSPQPLPPSFISPP